MALDPHKNFAVSAVATAPTPAGTGTSLTVRTAEGALFPAAPFQATVWPVGTVALASNAEIVRVTAKTGDVLTIVRGQEGSLARAIVVGDLIAATFTAKMIDDIAAAMQAPVSPLTITGPSIARLVLIDSSQPVNKKTIVLQNYQQQWWAQHTNDAINAVDTELKHDRTSGNLATTGGYLEKGRLIPIGHWIDVSYSGANFTSDVGTWVVDAGDVITNSYTLIGRTMLWLLFITSSTITGSPTGLRIALPAGLAIGKGFSGLLGNSSDGVVSMGNVSASQVQLGRVGGAAFTNATNTVLVAGCFTIPIS